MRIWRPLIAAVVLAAPGVTFAQDGGTTFNPCIDTTGQDRQPDFTADAGGYSAVLLTEDTPPKLRLNTNRNVLNPEQIILPFEQELEALIVDDRAFEGASHTLGWFYYQDLVDQGYVALNDPDNANDDTLIDADNSGVPDFHEDLYNLNPGRPYVGEGPRCAGRVFNHTKPDGGVVELREPDLLTGGCTEDSTYAATGGPRRWPDNDPLYGPKPGGAVVGRGVRWYDFTPSFIDLSLDVNADQPNFTRTDSWFSDRGLFPHIPNLLEPRDPRNANRGLGYITFFATDDDDNQCSNSDNAECLQPRMAWSADGTTQVGPIWDRVGAYDGIPDYKASAFDNRGRVIPGKNPAAAVNEEDRRVKMGRVAANKEIVFFLVTYVEQIYGRLNNGDQSTDSCFMTTTVNGRLQCQLWAHGDINVFFSKTLLNMDLHQATDPVVVTKNLRSGAGWLDNGAFARLETPEYGRVLFNQNQTKNVMAYGQRAAHTLVGAPLDNPRVWILGWEDQNSGGNRTYNDIVILINKQNNGVFKSEVVSDISPSISRDYTITSVTLTIDDHPFYDPLGDSGACTPSTQMPDGTYYRPRPSITYQVALDCKVCVSACNTDNPVFAPKPTEPEWITVPFTHPTAPPGERTQVTVSVNDFLERGYTGTQLCWRAILESPGEGCQPTIANVNVSYKAQRAGQYGRSGRIGVANTLLYGSGEVPGRNWAEDANLRPSNRLMTGRPDMSPRGHVYLKKLYEPEAPAVTLPTNDVANPPVWDAGEVQRAFIRSQDPHARKLFTRPSSGGRAEVKSLTGDLNPLFPTDGARDLCDPVAGETWDPDQRYDLNGDGRCDDDDRPVLRNWLYGFEQFTSSHPTDATRSPRRTWPMGSINLSTPALVGPPTDPGWLSNPAVSETEKSNYRTRFKGNPVIANRRNVAFIGTSQGFLHAFNAGSLKLDDDTCTSVTEYNGYFQHSTGCSVSRDYGTGQELFAYLPGKMLRSYVESYIRSQDPKRPPASMDASPAVGPVDLGPNTGLYHVRNGYAPDANTAWQLNTDPTQNTGAKTVLVSATGPQQSILFALDVTNPDSTNARYPWPMWEFDMAHERFDWYDSPHASCDEYWEWWCSTIPQIFAGPYHLPSAPVQPDSRGSRHNPLLLRMDFGTNRGGKKWVAAFATDFTPKPGTAGTLYLIDVKTGMPVQVSQGSGSLQQRLAGVVTLGASAADHGEGIGGDPVGVDADGDGSYDVLYVPSTSGRVYKVNLRDVDTSRPLGKVISSCVIADARTARYSNGSTVDNPSSQRIYSDMAVRVARSSSNATVSLYFGTANNPDTDTDADDLAATPPRYHVMAFQDTAPLTPSCTSGSQLWVQPLDPGQAVWGGLAILDDVVNTATAVGRRADVCSVDANTSGKFYALSQTSGAALAGSGTDLGGHSLSAPVTYDRHLILPITTNGTLDIRGNTGWQNPSGPSGATRSRVLIWDVRPGGNIREVIP